MEKNNETMNFKKINETDTTLAKFTRKKRGSK